MNKNRDLQKGHNPYLFNFVHKNGQKIYKKKLTNQKMKRKRKQGTDSLFLSLNFKIQVWGDSQKANRRVYIISALNKAEQTCPKRYVRIRYLHYHK